MKRLIVAFFILFFCFSNATAAESSGSNDISTYEIARGIANFMEDHYNIHILIGDECSSIITQGFELDGQVSGRTPFLNLLARENYEEDIKLLDDCLSFYPAGFFDTFKCSEAKYGIRFLIPNRITTNGSTMAGVTTLQDDYYNIFLGSGAFNSINVHHEIWHAMEYRITYDYPDVFDLWREMNPDNFSYTELYAGTDMYNNAVSVPEWFVKNYSMINEMEDRATVIEALFQYDSSWWNDHPYIKAKLDFLQNAAEPIFGNIYNQE